MIGLRITIFFGIVLTVLFFLNHEFVYSQAEPMGGFTAPESSDTSGQTDISEANNSPEGAGNVVGDVSLTSNREFVLSVIILVFGIAIVLIEYLLLKGTVNPNISDIMKIFTVTLIIIGTMLLITSGFSSQQISPAFGLFGTIAGYLLGREEQRKINSKEREKEADNV